MRIYGLSFQSEEDGRRKLHRTEEISNQRFFTKYPPADESLQEDSADDNFTEPVSWL